MCACCDATRQPLYDVRSTGVITEHYYGALHPSLGDAGYISQRLDDARVVPATFPKAEKLAKTASPATLKYMKKMGWEEKKRKEKNGRGKRVHAADYRVDTQKPVFRHGLVEATRG